MSVERVGSDAAPVFVLRNEIMVIATWQSLVIARWIKVPSPEDVRVMRGHIRTFVRRVGPFGALNFVEARNATSMNEDSRHEVAAVQREFENKQRCLATVIEGSGFWAATVRGVASGLALLSGAKFPQRIFADAEPAITWIAGLFPELGTDARGRIAEAVRIVRTSEMSPPPRP